MAKKKRKKVTNETNSKRKKVSKNKKELENTKSKKELKKEKKKLKRRKAKLIITLLLISICVVIGLYIYVNRMESSMVLREYFSYLQNKEYEKMYDLVETKNTKEEFVNRIKSIYEGIEAENISIQIATNSKNDLENENKITYNNSMKTIAGNINFINTVKLKHIDNRYIIEWSPSMIFPDLENENNKVRVKNIEAVRGSIYDRNGNALARDGEIYSVGLVPSKMDDTTNLNKIAELAQVNVDKIKKDLKAEYVNENTFVPIVKFSKEEQDKKNELLKIKGIMVTDEKARVYQYKEATSILTGYIQDGDGKTGLEYTFNDKLKGKDGVEIYIERDGQKVKTLAKKEVKDGENIKLTIDVETQTKIYNEFKDDEGAYISLNYKTGEILALVSTPSYNANDFIIGISEEEWNNLQNDAKKPMFNRYVGAYPPGSSIKPIVGVIGLMTNSFTASEDFGRSTNKWQQDSSWKDLFITTTETYNETANLENALVYSDNIYFAKAALKIGRENLTKWLDNFGFNEQIEFVQAVQKSSYGVMDSDASIANSGYGQSEVLVNPILMASIYSAFANEGNMVKPYLIYEENEENRVKYYKENVITSQNANIIKQDLIQVVERGTGKDCNIEGMTIAGKTGTAEIKESQQDKNGEEIGWFNCFDNTDKLIISMVENVKNRGGSHYVTRKVRKIWEK